MSPEVALCETVRYAAVHAGRYAEDETSAPWLVTGTVLMAQQAAAIALRAAGDSIPAQAGATELLLRAASKGRLPVPFTLPFSSSARQSFDQLVEARNAFMHPRAIEWHVTPQALVRGLPISTRIVRHLILIQPILTDLVSPSQQRQIESGLSDIEAFVEYLGEE